MSDIDEIRQQKRERLRRRAEDEAAGEPTDEPPSEPIDVESTDQFREVTDEFDVVLVDFYADWCGPCKQMEPIVAQIARETDAAVAKVDIDAHQQLAQRHQVRGVPTVVVFADGEPVEQSVGLASGDQLATLVGQYT